MDFLYVSKEDYDYLLSILKPQEIPALEMDTFLTSAYSWFIKNQYSPKVEFDRYVSYFQSKLIDPNIEIDGRSLLLFFAEHGLQKKKEENEKKE